VGLSTNDSPVWPLAAESVGQMIVEPLLLQPAVEQVRQMQAVAQIEQGLRQRELEQTKSWVE
jgi:hypothetical protein